MGKVYLGVGKITGKNTIYSLNVTYVAAPGEMTFARLYRDEKRNYKMAVIKGRFVNYPKSKNKKGTYEYLQAFTKLDIKDFDAMVGELGSHHILGVEGDYFKELRYFCDLYRIELVSF